MWREAGNFLLLFFEEFMTLYFIMSNKICIFVH